MKRLVALALLIGPSAAWAHGGGAHGAGWTWSPAVIVPLALALLVFALGFVRLWQRSDRRRSTMKRDAMLFLAGWIVLAGSLISPLHQGGEASFTLHMIEHELLMLVASLLLVAGRPGAVLLWAFPAPLRRGFGGAARWPIWSVLTDPFVATTLQAVAIVAWHVPWLFDLALGNEGWHVAQHLSFIATALLFWWAMLNGRSGRAGSLIAAVCLFAMSMIGGGLGALMSLSGSPWYEGYAALGLTPAGLTPQEDQQLAGLLMWIPGGLYHLAAALWFMMRALGSEAGGSHAVEPR